MKKFLVVAAFLVSGTGAMMAQSELAFGIKGGINFSSFSGDGYEAFDDNGRTSFHIGALVEIPIAEKFAIQPEVLYSGQGFDIIQRDNADDLEYQLDYINVPVMAKYYIVEGLYAEVGPQLGFNVKSEIDGDPDDRNSGDIPIDDNEINDVDFGVNFGAGYKLNNGLFVNARYSLGLSDVYNNEDLPINLDAKNVVFALSLGYIFQ